MRALLVRTSPGTGKTRAVAEAVRRHRSSARIVTGNLNLARELAAEHGYSLIQGRSPDNCPRFDVVEALGAAGHDVAPLACGRKLHPRCPLRDCCPYWQQFDADGVARVGAAEQLFNPTFLRGGSVAVVDDAELNRSLIERLLIKTEDLVRAHKLLKRKRHKPLRDLLVALTAAIMDAPTGEAGLPRRIIGAAVWDHLVKAGCLYNQDFVSLVRALPEKPSVPAPRADADGVLSKQAVEEAAPATIARLAEALQEELAPFLSGEDFNSHLRLTSEGIEIWRLREHVSDRYGAPVIAKMDLLVLDATPVASLVDHLTRLHERLLDVEATVRLPENVKVVQYTSSSNGHTVLRQPEQLRIVLAEVAGEREKSPVASPAEEGVICFKRHRASMVEAGFAEERIATYGGLRGTNALNAVERLHVVGRPMPPADELAFEAQVIHFGQPPISSELVLTPRSYGGQPYEVDVLDFADPRAAALLHSHREDEMLQAIHRARLFALDSAQMGLVNGGHRPRRQLRVVLHTSQPIPSLRVDELVLTSPAQTLNEQRQEDAEQRVRSAVLQLEEMCEPVTVNEVARLAKAHKQTVAKVLRTAVHTLNRDLDNGMNRFPQTDEEVTPSTLQQAIVSPSPVPDGLCRGGCGKPMPPGQMCFECARRETEAWRESQKRRRAR